MRYRRPLRERVREWMLPAPERRAARLERATEERMRRERDWYCERSRQRLRDEAESRKWSAFTY
jgi:hypothetical protein